MDSISRIETRSRLNTFGTQRTTDAHGRVIDEREQIHIHQASLMQTSAGQLIVFSTPSAVALALDEAIHAAKIANGLRGGLIWGKSNTPFGLADEIGERSQLTALFDCLQKSMVCVSFSYLALEVYCNESIGENENKPVVIEVKGREGKSRVTKAAKYWEDRTSTEDKLAIILPQIFDTATPRGRSEWEGLRKLQKARNEIIHAKAHMTNPKTKSYDEIPRASTFYRFLTEDATAYPAAAVRMILFFAQHRYVPSWLEDPMRRLHIEHPSSQK